MAFIRSLGAVTEQVFDRLQEAIELKLPESNGRVKRGVSALPIALSISSLLATGGFSLYFGLSLRDLQSYVQKLEEQMNEDRLFTDTVARNTRILTNNTELIGFRTNVISTSFVQFRKWATCTLFKIAGAIEKRHMFARMNSFVNSIIAGQLSPRVIPISVLKHLMKETTLIKNTLLMRDPLLFYQKTSVALRKIDREAHTVTLLLGIPRIKSLPDYVSINVVTPRTVITKRHIKRSRQLQFPPNLFLSMEFFNNSKVFPLDNAESFHGIRKLGGCGLIGLNRFCKEVYPPNHSDLECLRALTKQESSNGSCHVNEAIVGDEPVLSVEQGELGSLISTADSLSVFGVKDGRKERLSLASKHTNKRICMFIPAKYQSITVENKTYSESFKQQITATIDMSGSTTEVGFFSVSAPHWTDEETLERNITLQETEKMIRKHISFGFMGSGYSLEIMLIFGLSILVAIAFLFMFAMRKGWIRIHTRRGRNPGDMDMPDMRSLANPTNPT